MTHFGMCGHMLSPFRGRDIFREGYFWEMVFLAAFQACDSSAETRISAVLELNVVISVIRPDPRCFFNMGEG